MKKFSELSQQEFEQIINRSKKLRDELDEYIIDKEYNWLDEKLDCVKESLSDWNISFFETCSMNVKDWEGFFDGVKKCTYHYGCSDRLEKEIAICEKLKNTNFFEYYCKKLKDMWLEDEIKSIINYVEDASFELYKGMVGEKSRSYLETFFESYDDYLYDEETGCFYEPTKLDVA